jgi:hypothetical protein
MLVKSFPEFFASYKIYEVVEGILKRNMREVDVNKVINELMLVEAKPSDFIRKLAVVLNKHIHSGKVNAVILDIKEALRDLIGLEVEPRKIELTKSGKEILRVSVENKTDAALKFRVGIKQLDRTYTAVLFDSVQGYSFTKFIKSSVIEPGKVHIFKFQIKADVFGIQDLYELKQKKKLMILLGLQVEAEGVDGLVSSTQKVEVNFVQVRI